MAIIRTKRENNFVVLNSAIFRGKLSYQAMGLLGYLIDKPDDWNVRVEQLSARTKDTEKYNGKESIYSMLNELKRAGFVICKKRASGETDYYVYDTPQIEPNQEKPNQAKPDVLIRNNSYQEIKKQQEKSCDGGLSIAT